MINYIFVGAMERGRGAKGEDSLRCLKVDDQVFDIEGRNFAVVAQN